MRTLSQTLQKQHAELRKILEKRTKLINNHSIPKLPLGDFAKFNETIGNPKHPETGLRSPILDFQLELHSRIKKTRRHITNKSRKIGSSEIHLRTGAELTFSEMIGHGGMIVFGNRQNEANKFIDDMDALYHDGFTDLNGRKWVYGDIVSNKRSNRIEFYWDTYFESFPADPTALRSQKNIRFIMISEAAHSKRIDDSKIWTAVRPILSNDPLCYFLPESTPNGMRGWYYDQSMLAQQGKNDMAYSEFPYTVALGTLLDPAFIEAEKKNPYINFKQEYMCEFSASNSSAFKPEDVVYVPERVTDWSEIV